MALLAMASAKHSAGVDRAIDSEERRAPASTKAIAHVLANFAAGCLLSLGCRNSPRTARLRALASGINTQRRGIRRWPMARAASRNVGTTAVDGERSSRGLRWRSRSNQQTRCEVCGLYCRVTRLGWEHTTVGWRPASSSVTFTGTANPLPKTCKSYLQSSQEQQAATEA